MPRHGTMPNGPRWRVTGKKGRRANSTDDVTKYTQIRLKPQGPLKSNIILSWWFYRASPSKTSFKVPDWCIWHKEMCYLSTRRNNANKNKGARLREPLSLNMTATSSASLLKAAQVRDGRRLLLQIQGQDTIAIQWNKVSQILLLSECASRDTCKAGRAKLRRRGHS